MKYGRSYLHINDHGVVSNILFLVCINISTCVSMRWLGSWHCCMELINGIDQNSLSDNNNVNPPFYGLNLEHPGQGCQPTD